MQEVENGLCELIVAAKKGDLDSALLLLSDLEFCDGHGKNAVMHALENRHLDLAERLIRHALSLPQSRCLVHVSVFGRSPLHFACAAGANTCAQLLLSAKDVVVNGKDSQGNTALHCATGSASLVSLLLEAGADPQLRNLAGQAPSDLTTDAIVLGLLASMTTPLSNEQVVIRSAAPVGAEIKVPTKKAKMNIKLKTIPPK